VFVSEEIEYKNFLICVRKILW